MAANEHPPQLLTHARVERAEPGLHAPEAVKTEGADLAHGRKLLEDLILLALGFLGPVRNGMIEQLGVKLDPRGNVATDENYMSSIPGIFAAGDMRRGQSLVVWAINEGRRAAQGVNRYLLNLPTRG